MPQDSSVFQWIPKGKDKEKLEVSGATTFHHWHGKSHTSFELHKKIIVYDGCTRPRILRGTVNDPRILRGTVNDPTKAPTAHMSAEFTLTISWSSGHTSSLGPWSFSQFPLISPEPYCEKRRIKHCSSHSRYILIDQLKKDFLVLHIELCMNPAHNMLPVNFPINPEQNGILGLGLLQLAGRMGQLKGEQNNTAQVVSFMFTITSQWGNHTIRTTTKSYKLQGSHTHNTIIMTWRPLSIQGSLGGACLLQSLLVAVCHQNPVAGDTSVLGNTANETINWQNLDT